MTAFSLALIACPRRHWLWLVLLASTTAISNVTASCANPSTQHQDSVQSFLMDLKKLHSMHNSTSLLLIPTHSKYDSSYTKAWTNKNWEFHQIRSFWRYQRHIKSWGKSPTARAVLPTVVSIVVWSLLVYFVSQRFSVVTTEASFSTGIASFTAPISLLLALRTNRSLTRLLEARIMYGRMVRACGSLACLVANYVAPLDVSKAILMARYLSIYGWTVKGWCREEDAHHVCRVMLPYSEATWLEQSPADLPTSIIFRLRQLISTSVNDLPLSAANAMEDRLVDFEDILGIFRRLLGSPIPPTYTRHTSRVLCLYLGLLPIALVSSNASLLSMLITVSVCSYVFVGLDETSVKIEHPFPLIPMYHLSSTMQTNVGNQFLMMDQLTATYPE